MAGMNQYFQLTENFGMASLRIFPPQGGGKKLELKEVQHYLEEAGYSKVDARELSDALKQTGGICDVPLGPWLGFYENEKMKISVSGDKMLAYARFYAPADKGKVMDAQEIIRDLEASRITVGILEDAVREFTENREYCRDILLAKGIPPTQGADGKIKYLFNTNLNMKPKRNEDGTVNYRELNTINHVEAGQCLAQMIKEVPGESGETVYGDVVQPRQVKPASFSFSNNIELTEDGMELHSQVAGHVNLVRGQVFVSEVFEVPADVDNTTGNIVYEGNVWVKGNVKSGFSIQSKGDIVVEGVVEGAELNAGGQIIVKRGIHGMSKGNLKAGSNIITKFIANATVSAGGYIETESILHSFASARTEVKVGGKKGSITGGTIRAGKLVDANNIGSEMGAATRIEVGVEPEVKEHYNALQKEIMQLNKEMNQVRPVLQNYASGKVEQMSTEKQRQIQMMINSFREKKKRLDEVQEEFTSLHEVVSMSSNARVRIRGTIYPGVWVNVSDIGMSIKNNYSNSAIFKDKGEIVIRPQ